jgi:hypothetical protein
MILEFYPELLLGDWVPLVKKLNAKTTGKRQ